jgi:hypothetical protein
MGISDLLRKFLGGNVNRSADGTVIRGKTPDEVELESYEREEYLQNVKKKLQYFRNKKNHDALVGSNPLSQKGTILQKHKYQLMK